MLCGPMRRGLLIVASLALLAAEPSPFGTFGPAAISEAPLAVVAEPVFTREVPPRDHGPDVIVLDSEWQSRFRVIDTVVGEFAGHTVDFTAWDHYGKPRYSAADGPVILYLWRDADYGFVHDKYNFDRVYPVRGGGYATCGSPFEDAAREGGWPYNVEGTEAPPHPQALVFDPPVVIDVQTRMLTLSAEDVADARNEAELAEWQAEIDADNQDIDAEFQPPLYSRDGTTATCRMGVPARSVARHKARTELRHERVRTHCTVQHAALKPDWDTFPGTSEGEEARDAAGEAYNDAVRTCTETLYRAGWPYTD